MKLAFTEDPAQRFLGEYLQKTEQVFEYALRKFDINATCAIIPAADLCLPHDVIRLCGGFATGCFVTWQCSTPVIPIDTNVNIDTSSIFWLDEIPTLTENDFLRLRRSIEEDSSYEWNFHKGNHFISLVRRNSDDRPALIIHSNEKEFKFQYNGLAPTEGNWYSDSIQTFSTNGRYIRLLVGEKVELFYEMAKLLEPFNVLRHRFIATQLLKRRKFEDEHHHHYYMPDRNSVAMGCFLQNKPSIVPIFSAPGMDISLFRPAYGGSNQITYQDETALLIPHGWGKTMLSLSEITPSSKGVTLNGRFYHNKPKVSIGKDPALVVREFDQNPSSPTSMFSLMARHTPGTVVETLTQIAWFNKDGYAAKQ